MVFRLPTPFDAILPHAPLSNGRNVRRRPWRGAFILHGINLFQSPGGQQRLFVAASETEGDKSSRTDLWPKQFDMHVAQPTCRLSDVQAWVTRNDIPLCMFMPDRHAAGGISSLSSVANETHFRTLSSVLSENQLLCIAPWPSPGQPETRLGAGILVLPNSASTGLLIGAIFVDTPFPDFLGFTPGNDTYSSASAIPSGLPSSTSAESGPPTFSSNTDSSAFVPFADTGPGTFGPVTGQVQSQGPTQAREHPQYQLGHVRVHPGDNSPATPRSIQPPQSFPMAPSTVSGGGITNQTQYQSYAKPQMDGFSAGEGAMGQAMLRASLASAPFDWSMFDDTDGSGSTSPGSTRTW